MRGVDSISLEFSTGDVLRGMTAANLLDVMWITSQFYINFDHHIFLAEKKEWQEELLPILQQNEKFEDNPGLSIVESISHEAYKVIRKRPITVSDEKIWLSLRDSESDVVYKIKEVNGYRCSVEIATNYDVILGMIEATGAVTQVEINKCRAVMVGEMGMIKRSRPRGMTSAVYVFTIDGLDYQETLKGEKPVMRAVKEIPPADIVIDSADEPTKPNY